MKFLRAIRLLLPFFLLLSALLFVLFFPFGKNTPAATRVVTVWNVDTFEGGRGSRTAFLRSVARRVEKEREGVYFLVTDYTAEGAEAACREGNSPDLLCFGLGLDCFAEKSLPLPFSFAGGTVGEDCLAVPWYAGGYFLFSLTENFDEEGSCVISVGGKNLPVLAARYAGIAGETADSLAAYTGFLSGKYRYLLGTQRDVQRFLSRQISVCSKPLLAYTDLIGYVSVLKRGEDASAFLAALLSEETRARLGEIGLFAPDFPQGTKTPALFSDGKALADLAARAPSDSIKNLDKYLKTI